jgi:hypothetical protein
MKQYYGFGGKKHDFIKLDEYIHLNFIKEPFENGSFLELGAINGVRFSNTKFFEDNMGFNRGVLIEAVPSLFKELQINRPNCECFNFAVHSNLKSVEFFISDKHTWGGCINQDSCKLHIDLFHKGGQYAGHSNIKLLPAERMDIILQKSKLKYIDFWSLDVEGSELECLKSMNWSIPTGLICVENSENRKQIDKIMKEQGFSLIEQRVNDGFYFNFKYFRKNLFSINS